MRVFSRATAVAIVCALSIGMLHAVGAKFLNWMWLVWTGK